MPVVSVIIPNYNHGKYLRQRIESVINQNFQDFELIILDDCSTDNSYQIINEYKTHPRVNHIEFNDSNSGSPFKQWRKGIELATGKFIWIAESDDWAEPSFLSELILYAHKYPEVSLLYTDSKIIFDNKIELMGPVHNGAFRYYSTNELLKKRLINGIDIYNGSAVIFKREIALNFIQELSGYQKHGDYFLWIKASKNTDALFVNRPLNNFRVLADSVTRLSIKDDTSLNEQLDIFALLTKDLSILSVREKFVFYNCWSLKFSILQKKANVAKKLFNPSSNVAQLTFYSIYFWIKFLYHYSFFNRKNINATIRENRRTN